MKKEYKMESLNICISELQQQTYAQRLELQDAQHGYVEFRREQVRLQEELSMKEKALRETQIRSMHEIGELKRAQELTNSLYKNREKVMMQYRSSLHRYKSCKRVNCMNYFGEFQDTESTYSGQFSHVPSQPAAVPSPRCILSRDRHMPFGSWNLSVPQGNVFGNSRPCSIHHRHVIKEFFTPRL